MKNIFENISSFLSEELIETLIEKNNIKIERIVSRGHASPKEFWYDQAQDEFIILLSGTATIVYENKQIFKMKKGDYLIIPAHQKHRVEDTNKDRDTYWLAIHF